MTDRIEAPSTGGKQVSDTSKEAVERLALDCERAISALQDDFPTGQAIYKDCAIKLRALQSEVEALREQAVTVKPLHWTAQGRDAVAISPLGDWCVRWDDETGHWFAAFEGVEPDPYIIPPGDQPSFEVAKQAAWDHYQRTILSALDTVSVAQVRKEALEQAYAALPNAGKDTDGKDAGEGYDEAVMDAKYAIRALIEKEGE
jgi:hypothetical protein